MRIDYSEPRQSYTTPAPSRHRPGSGVSSTKAVAIAICCAVLFGSGFGVGWYFSQQSAKKAFRAAMEQQSLETAPKNGASQTPAHPTAQPASQQGTAAPVAQQVQPGTTPAPQQASTPATGPNGQPLSFFDNLPKGQKNTVLGSGINEKPKPVTPPVAPAPSVQSGTQATAAKKTDIKKTDPSSTAASKAAPQPSGYLVQVASYNNRKDADSLKAKLVAKGYAATVSETTLGDKTWHRVRIGRHLDKESASQIANQLMMGAKIIPDQD